MTCDGYDVIANSMNTPNMEVGDWIVVGGIKYLIIYYKRDGIIHCWAIIKIQWYECLKKNCLMEK